jgi:F0F1-type ATP synthase assembly protein I
MPSPEKQLPSFVKYSSMAFQMGIIMFGTAWGGVELDKYVTSIDFPLFTILLVILGVFAAIYLTLKDFIKPKK